MSGYQPMTPLLCQVMPYPPLEEDDEFTTKHMSSATAVPHPLIEDSTDDVNNSLPSHLSSLIYILLLDFTIIEIIFEKCLTKRSSISNTPLGLENRVGYNEYKVS